MHIKPDFLTFDSLLQKRLFRIPEFQRAYSWENKQRSDLFKDIRNLSEIKNDRHHFMALIVCLDTNNYEEVDADQFEIFEVVDGQQRLTTLIILLKALAKSIQEGNERKRKTAEKLNELLVKEDERLILLQTNHDSSSIFRNYLKKGIIPEEKTEKTLADKNLIKALIDCEKFVNEWKEGPLSLLKIIKNRLDFILYVLNDEGSVYTIFEVLNSRGLDVDWLDKCKSMLMGITFKHYGARVSSEHINELHKCWTKIYQTVGVRNIPGHEIMRFAATLQHPNPQSKIISAEKAMEFFRDYSEKNPSEIVDISETFLEIAKKLEQLYKNPRLRCVTDIIHVRLLAISILMKKSLNESDIDEILQHWEKVAFRIFGISRKDARTGIGEYTRLSREVHKDEATKTDIIKKINNLIYREDNGRKHDLYQVPKSIKDLPNDWYNGRESDLIYLLYRYEEYLCENEGASISEEVWEQIWSYSPNSTIEHIHPQNPGHEWSGKLGEKRDAVENNVNRLGNLMLLPPGVNSQAGRKSFKEKKEIYRRNIQLRMVREVMYKRDWNIQRINERERKLLKWIKETWG